MLKLFRSPSRAVHAVLSLVCAFIVTRSETWAEALERHPLRERAARAVGSPLFSALDPAVTGVDFVNELVAGHPLEHLYASEKAVGGVAVGDVDGDGRPDLYFTNGPGRNRLFRQVSAFKFEDITERAGVDGGENWGAGAAMADIDNDGDLDLYVANYDAANQLFLNKGDGTFEEGAAGFGLDLTSASHMPTFCDYDRDGDLDLFLLTNRLHAQEGMPDTSEVIELKQVGEEVLVYFRDPAWWRYYEIVPFATPPGAAPQFTLVNIGQPDYLYRNDGRDDSTGRLKFTDVTKKSGIASRGFGLSATWWDHNQDGWPDLWVGNDLKSPDNIYRNNRDGTFTDVVKEIVPHITWFSMGADFGDLDGDARPDFLIADMSGTTHFKRKTAMGAMSANAQFLKTSNPSQYMRNALFLNSGTERFLEGAFLAGLANSDWTWSVKIADLDNDGRSDVFFTNGMTRDFNISDNAAAAPRLYENEWARHLRAGTPELREQNLAFRNRGDLVFDDVSKDWGLDLVGMSFASAEADLDGDGDLDLVVTNANAPVTLYRNNDAAGHRLVIRLAGSRSNRFGLGAKVRLESASGSQQRELTPVRGYLASNEPSLHFGLGTDTVVTRLTIDWPSGERQVFSELAADQVLTITEPPEEITPVPPPAKAAPRFVTSAHLARAYHADNVYDDFARQPLLPHKLSQLGGGQAWGDFDGDGDDDFWIGSGYGLPGQLWRNEGTGRYVTHESAALAADANQEDMGGLWFDADGDRDLDLYVVSGGYEFAADGPELEDRLYLNDGSGALTRAPLGALPEVRISGSVVCAADFDRDGDLDLFVGGRLIPGEYPATPRSLLLRNDGGRFTDQAASLAPGLGETGLVTSALWSDPDRDGWPDLFIACDWGPVAFYRNLEGKFQDETAPSGLAEFSGWWNGLTARDLDGDGDLDYIATNFGLNTKYHATRSKPTLLYYGDFEGSGPRQIVEAEYEHEILYPVRGRSCSMAAMPHLRNSYPTFAKFARDSLSAIYTPERLAAALRRSATTLESGVFRTEVRPDRSIHFEFVPLPRHAQLAPSFGVVATEINGDAHPDLVLLQNFSGPQPETGRMAGGLGALLLGKGDGAFEAVPASESGIAISGDGRSLTLADLEGDGRADLCAGLNHDLVRTLLTQDPDPNALFTVRLGVPVPGTMVTCLLSDDSRQTAEWHAGGGYLSQDAPLLTFGVPAGTTIRAISVRWPQGTTTRHEVADGATQMVVAP